MAKLTSETLLGVGLLDATPAREPALLDDILPGDPVPSLVDTHRGQGQSNETTSEPGIDGDRDSHSDVKITARTQPGLGVKPRMPASVRRSGTQVRVSTQNGASVRPGVSPTSELEPVAQTPAPASLPSSAAHDTLRGVGANGTADHSRTLPFMSPPKRTEVTAGEAVDLDVYTSAPGVTLPIGTLMPKSIMDAQRPRVRGFATNPPVTPKVLLGLEQAANSDSAPEWDEARRLDNSLDATPSPTTPRVERRHVSGNSMTTAEAPKAPWTTLTSGRIETQPVPIHRPTDETFRPSAHTTPPGAPELRHRRPNYLWVLAAIPLGLIVTLATVKVEGTSAVQGALVLDGGTTPVVNQVSGPVLQVLVKPGDTVAAGQSVAEIDPTTLDERREALLTQQSALIAEQERAMTLGAKWHTAATEALQRKRGLLWQRLNLRAKAATAASGGAVSSVKDTSSAERDAVLLIRQELADVEFELNRRESDRDEQQLTWDRRMNEVRLALAQVNDTSTSVRAPVAGRVEALLVTPGQVLTAGSPVAQLIPEGAATQIVVLVPTRLSAALDVGSELTVTLPLAESGALPARVTRIGDGNVTREEAASLLNAPLVEPLVRVDVELVDPASVTNLATAMRPGQRIAALVPDEQQTVWRQLVSKFQ